MSSTITPINQKIHLDAYTGKLFDFNNVNSKIYIARTINNLLNTFGSDCIISGLEIKNISYDCDDVLKLEITSGKAIIDTTLIEYPQNMNVEIDLTDYDDTGYVIVVISFNYLHNSYKNISKIKTLYVKDTNNINGFFTKYDRVILGKLSFNKTTKRAFLDSNTTSLTLLGKEIEIRPLNDIDKSVYKMITGMFY